MAKVYSRPEISSKMRKLQESLVTYLEPIAEESSGRERQRINKVIQNLKVTNDMIVNLFLERRKLIGTGSYSSFKKSLLGKEFSEKLKNDILNAFLKKQFKGSNNRSFFDFDTKRTKRRNRKRKEGSSLFQTNKDNIVKKNNFFIPNISTSSKPLSQDSQNNDDSEKESYTTPIKTPDYTAQYGVAMPEQSSDSPLSNHKNTYGDLSQINTLAARNVNPGNVTALSENSYLGQTGKDKRGFAQFASKEAGVAAIVNRLFRYNGDKKNASDSIGGKKTIADIIHVYAPPHENNTKWYIDTVSKQTGIAPNAPIDLRQNPEFVEPLVKVIMQIEDNKGSKTYSNEQVKKGIEIGFSEHVEGKDKAREIYKEYLEPKKDTALADNSQSNSASSSLPNNINPSFSYDLNKNNDISPDTNSYANASDSPALQTPMDVINKSLYDQTKDATGKLRYGYGSKGENGRIDCSGWVQQAIRKAGASPVLLQYIQGRTAAEQVLRTGEVTGTKAALASLTPSNVREGMLVGARNRASREGGIGHVGIVLKNPETGELGVSHSSTSKGVHWQPLAGFNRDFGKNGFIIADPFVAERNYDKQNQPLYANNTNPNEDLSFQRYLEQERGAKIDPLKEDLGLGASAYAQMQREYSEWHKVKTGSLPNHADPLMNRNPSMYASNNHAIAEPLRSPTNKGPVANREIHRGAKEHPVKAVADNTVKNQENYQAQLKMPMNVQRPLLNDPSSPGTGSLPDSKPTWTNFFEGVSDATRNMFIEIGDVFT